MSLATAATFATVYQTIGMTLFAIVVVATVLYVVVNVLFSGKAELGSELELAANRRPYYSDEVLEGPKLDRSLTLALSFLFILAVGIPLYWIMEPARQENAAEGFNEKFISQGEELFAATGENAVALNCAGCHGGLTGGARDGFVLTDPATGDVSVVDWKAPALGSVLLRFSREEVRFILTYGRPGSPMPPWGVAGGGPLNDQEIQNLIDYLDANQISPEEAQEAAAAELERYMDATFDDGGRVFRTEGEALFNLGLLEGNFAGGAFACARCHTAGWSYAPVESALDEDGNIVVDRASYEAATVNNGCGGAFGPSLCDNSTVRQFPAAEDHVLFVTDGSQNGIGYGQQGQGTGKMPGFGLTPAEPALFWINGGEERPPGPGMLTQENIEAIVDYERELQSADAQAAGR
jgi:mono/diheme cytochrome c family protein